MTTKSSQIESYTDASLLFSAGEVVVNVAVFLGPIQNDPIIEKHLSLTDILQSSFDMDVVGPHSNNPRIYQDQLDYYNKMLDAAMNDLAQFKDRVNSLSVINLPNYQK